MESEAWLDDNWQRVGFKPLDECLAVKARRRYCWQPCGECDWCQEQVRLEYLGVGAIEDASQDALLVGIETWGDA